MKIIKLTYVLIIIISILVFDLISYNLLPSSFTTFVPLYKYDESENVAKLENIPSVARRYPRYYHVKR